MTRHNQRRTNQTNELSTVPQSRHAFFDEIEAHDSSRTGTPRTVHQKTNPVDTYSHPKAVPTPSYPRLGLVSRQARSRTTSFPGTGETPDSEASAGVTSTYQEPIGTRTDTDSDAATRPAAYQGVAA